LPLLQNMMPQTKKLTLKTPWRWCEGDALEALVNRLLLLGAQLTPLTQQDVSAQTTIAELNRRDLLVNEALLEQIFALLVTAHYQTSPDDLRLLLDHPLLKVFVLLSNDEVLATALVMQEGDFTEDWQQKIESGRRGAGHILPQALFGDGFDVLDKRFWRVLRIAVRPELQNQGFGQQLLAYLKQHLQGDFLGASFSADAGVIAFWQKTGLQVCRLGSHKEAATGQYACIVLSALNQPAEVLLQTIRQEWAKKLPITLLSLNQDIETAVVPYLLHGLEFECSAKAKAQCQAFVEHRRSLEQVFADVHALLLHYLAKYPPSTQAQTAIEKVLLNHAWQTVAEKQSLTGRKNVEQQIRTSVQTMMQRLQEQKNE
jgi:tRNA(Met) cytidine acetyltransferase